ncbi:MAG: GTP-binding protein [Desulfobacterales bacterium]|nr:GTP-binding protein [Desulfobacterales bacterium]
MNPSSPDLSRVLSTLLPPSALANKETLPYELIRAVLVRANFNPGTRHRLGWRGIQEIPLAGEMPGAMTVKAAGRPGIFGLRPRPQAPVFNRKGWAQFALTYFPDPEESLVESFSIEAGLEIMSENFIERVRRFPLDPVLPRLFFIAVLQARADHNGIYLSMTADRQILSRSPQGISVMTPEGPVQAVPPGGVNQNLAALDLALSFFSPLAASLTYTLAMPPCIFEEDIPIQAPDQGTATRLTLGYLNPTATERPSHPPGYVNKLRWTRGEPVPAPYREAPWWSGLPSALPAKPCPVPGEDQPGNTVQKPGFILLTGFLGSGKTSFLNRFIQAQTQAHRFVAVVQNEIGEKGLDADLLDQTYAVTRMDEGCVCCSLAGNLRAALNSILSRFDPDIIVLETTGLANPANMLREIEELGDILDFRSLTTLVDGIGGKDSLDRFEVARDQVRLADQILVNKCDLAGPEEITRLEKRIRRFNPWAKLHRVSHGDIHPGLLYGVNVMNPPARPLFQAVSAGATHSDDELETRLFTPDRPLDPDQLIRSVHAGGDEILRAKGIVELHNTPGPMVFQYAPGTSGFTPLQGPDPGDRFLVVIGRNLDQRFNWSAAHQS